MVRLVLQQPSSANDGNVVTLSLLGLKSCHLIRSISKALLLAIASAVALWPRAASKGEREPQYRGGGSGDRFGKNPDCRSKQNVKSYLLPPAMVASELSG